MTSLDKFHCTLVCSLQAVKRKVFYPDFAQHQPSESTPVVPSASPTESESQPEFPHVTQYFSLAIVEDESMDRQSLSFSGPSVPDVSSILSTPAAKEGSVKHQKQKSGTADY